MKAFIIVTACLMMVACGTPENKNETIDKKQADVLVTLTKQQLSNAEIQTTIPQEKALSSILKVNGKIDVAPQNIVSVSVPLGGYLRSAALLPGMKIEKGQIIARIEDPQYIQIQQDYLTSETRLTYLEQEYNRQKELNNSKASSDKVFQKTEAEFKSEKILRKSLYEKLKLIGLNPDGLNENNLSRILEIRAPITGFVSSASANTGKYITPSDVLYELINPEDIHLGLFVFEKDLGSLSVGQELVAYSNHNPTKKYRCKIILMSRNLSEERSGEVHCQFEMYEPSLIPGMFMNADIEVKTDKVLALPEEAIVSFENKQYVFVQKESEVFEMTEVQTGKTENGFVELVSYTGAPQQKVVVKGAYTLLMALKNKSEGE